MARIILEAYPLAVMRIIFAFKALYAKAMPWAKDRLHWGVDLEAYFVPCMAMAAGIVVRASRFDPGWGRYVTIQHPGGWQTIYAHLSQVDVREGEQIVAGQVIGITGDSGSAEDQPHLHIELRMPGAPGAGPRGQLDPLLYVMAQPPTITPPPVFEQPSVVGYEIALPVRWRLVQPVLNIRTVPSALDDRTIVGQMVQGDEVEGAAISGAEVWVRIAGEPVTWCAALHGGRVYLEVVI